ncbi:type III-B CRISPR module RAMP protein Cmr1 [Thauera butanivorans]|uniref:type III-B CRISPR module RAMP protein Cmr1 n=1 Tax=Thauera butanivorans TaxID=86174 RepID=UPI003AB84ECE
MSTGNPPLQQPEGKTLEFKRDLSSPRNVLRTLVAFANSAGGRLVIGVDDARNAVGVADPLDEEERLCNLIVTPMFLGGENHEVDHTQMRNASLKGALRFWWRALNWGANAEGSQSGRNRCAEKAACRRRPLVRQSQRWQLPFRVCLAAHFGSFIDGLPHKSNFYCHPGTAGGFPGLV